MTPDRICQLADRFDELARSLRGLAADVLGDDVRPADHWIDPGATVAVCGATAAPGATCPAYVTCRPCSIILERRGMRRRFPKG